MRTLTIIRIVRNALLAAAAAYACVFGFMYFRQDAMIFPVPARAAPMPKLSGLHAVKITTPDGETLDGWFFAPEPGRPLVLAFHGNGGRGARFAEMGAAFHARGFGFLAAAWRGYAPSTGTPSQAGLLTDGLALFDWAKRNCACEIVILANSLGTGVGVHTAGMREAKALILASPFSSAVDVAAERYWYLPVRPFFKNPFPSTDWIKHVTEPLLILHGGKDQTIPFRYGRQLYDAATGQKTMKGYADMGHSLFFDADMPAKTEAFLTQLPAP
jgi:uncharacterized protein